LFYFEICSVLKFCLDSKFVQIHFFVLNLLSFWILFSFDICSNSSFVLFWNLPSFQIFLNSNFAVFWNMLKLKFCYILKFSHFEILFSIEIYFEFKFCSISKFSQFPLKFVQLRKRCNSCRRRFKLEPVYWSSGAEATGFVLVWCCMPEKVSIYFRWANELMGQPTRKRARGAVGAAVNPGNCFTPTCSVGSRCRTPSSHMWARHIRHVFIYFLLRF
jgi:hypothetical protein